MHAVNLLPNEQRSAASGSAPGRGGAGAPVGALTILALLVVAVAVLALRVEGTNTVKEREAELAAATQQVEAVQAQAAALQRYEAFQQLAQTRVSTVAALAEGRFPWSRTLRDIARVLPRDVFLEALCADGGSQSCSTELRGALAGATAVGLTGCTSSQDAVARLMTRLRDVRGVTRVTLESSVSATGSEGDDNVSCPPGNPPAFQVLVFFERAPIAAAGLANAESATAAPSATPAPGATPTPAPGATAAPDAGTATAAVTPTPEATP